MNKFENISVLNHEMDWLAKVIEQAVRSYMQAEGGENNWIDIPVPDLENSSSPYAIKLKEWNVSVLERLALVLAMAPYIRPQVLDVFFGHNKIFNRAYTEFGGVTDKEFSGFLPTGQTLIFISTSKKREILADIADILNPENILIKEQVLELQFVNGYLPSWSGILSMSHQWMHYFLNGQEIRPELSASFPAKRITTLMNWDDLVLDPFVMEQVLEIDNWLQYGDKLMQEWGLKKKIKPGFRTLFYGPPGTGKTLTATLLGKSTNRDVYRVDLSMVVSKYIGETEKNLSKVFDAAAYKDWILFFDEADALFGKRTAANNSNDRYANQQTSYLLQKVEDFPGLVILASNLKANMDEAFTRRFQSMIHFDMPSADERLKLWQSAFSGKCRLHPEIDIEQIAETYEIAGGGIINILRTSALSAISRNDNVVQKYELMDGLRREFKKDNKTIVID